MHVGAHWRTYGWMNWIVSILVNVNRNRPSEIVFHEFDVAFGSNGWGGGGWAKRFDRFENYNIVKPSHIIISMYEVIKLHVPVYCGGAAPDRTMFAPASDSDLLH